MRSVADSRTRFASSVRSWFIVSRLWRSSKIWVALRRSSAVRRAIESTFLRLRTLTPWMRKTFLELAGGDDEEDFVAVILEGV